MAGPRLEPRLVAAPQRNDEQFRRTGAPIRALAEQGARTDSHLGVVIDMFERRLREDHGREPT